MNKNSKQTLIAKIHIAKKELALDDETYRDVLERVTGKTSCKGMNLNELKAVVMDLKRLGFTPKQTAKTQTDHGRRPTTTADKQPMLDKIEAILTDRGLHWHYAHGMAKKMFGKELVTWLTTEQMYKVVQALLVYQKRHANSQTADK